MSGYREILALGFKTQGKSHDDVAKLMGWDSGSTVGNKLRSERRIQIRELEQMAKIAGYTLIQLAAASDDFTLAEHQESVQAAALVDSWDAETRALALKMLAAIGAGAKPSQS